MTWQFDNHLKQILAVSLAGILVITAGCSGGNGPADPPADPVAYTNADGFNGGQLFDKFWSSETGWNQSDPNIATFDGSADFFRCKQCHGWDRLGTGGAYISRGPKTTRPNVSSLNLNTVAAGMTPQALFDSLKSSAGRRAITADLSTYDPVANPGTGDMMPDIGSLFSDGQLWDIVKFLKTEAVSTGSIYDSVTSGSYPSGSIAFSNIGKDGDAVNGNSLYTANCAGCHGADGRNFLVDGDEYTAGSFIRQKPNEAQHKIKFGQLGSAMTGLITNDDDLKDIYKALSDPMAFPDPPSA